MEYTKGTKVFGDWEIVRELGEGAAGKVFEIRKTDFGVTARSALKVIRVPRSAADIKAAISEGMDEQSVTSYFQGFVEEIVKEIALMAEIKGHPGIVSYEDHKVITHEGEIGWDILIRMELLTPLVDYQMKHRFDEADVLRMGKELCDALAFCQKKGLIHRDIKPENIFVSGTGQFKLGDFGVARTVEKTTGGLSKKGTESYMAPEVYLGRPYGSGVDIYSLGLVLYKFLNKNRLPFFPAPPKPIGFSDRENALASRMRGEPLPVPSEAGEDFAKVILKACAYDPKERYHTAGEMLEALRGVRAAENAEEPEMGAGAAEADEAEADSGEEATIGMEFDFPGHGDDSGMTEGGRAGDSLAGADSGEEATIGMNFDFPGGRDDSGMAGDDRLGDIPAAEQDHEENGKENRKESGKENGEESGKESREADAEKTGPEAGRKAKTRGISRKKWAVAGGALLIVCAVLLVFRLFIWDSLPKQMPDGASSLTYKNLKMMSAWEKVTAGMISNLNDNASGFDYYSCPMEELADELAAIGKEGGYLVKFKTDNNKFVDYPVVYIPPMEDTGVAAYYCDTETEETIMIITINENTSSDDRIRSVFWGIGEDKDVSYDEKWLEAHDRDLRFLCGALLPRFLLDALPGNRLGVEIEPALSSLGMTDEMRQWAQLAKGSEYTAQWEYNDEAIWSVWCDNDIVSELGFDQHGNTFFSSKMYFLCDNEENTRLDAVSAWIYNVNAYLGAHPVSDGKNRSAVQDRGVSRDTDVQDAESSETLGSEQPSGYLQAAEETPGQEDTAPDSAAFGQTGLKEFMGSDTAPTDEDLEMMAAWERFLTKQCSVLEHDNPLGIDYLSWSLEDIGAKLELAGFVFKEGYRDYGNEPVVYEEYASSASVLEAAVVNPETLEKIAYITVRDSDIFPADSEQSILQRSVEWQIATELEREQMSYEEIGETFGQDHEFLEPLYKTVSEPFNFALFANIPYALSVLDMTEEMDQWILALDDGSASWKYENGDLWSVDHMYSSEYPECYTSCRVQGNDYGIYLKLSFDREDPHDVHSSRWLGSISLTVRDVEAYVGDR